MKKTKILYWVFTGLFSFLMLGSAIPDIFSVQVAVEGFSKMGYPAYLLPFLGIAKLLGVAAILVPGNYPRIKEWAYAGLVFDLLGATYSIMSNGQPAGDWIFMALPLMLAAGSYIFHHKMLRASLAKHAVRDTYAIQAGLKNDLLTSAMGLIRTIPKKMDML